MPGAGRAEIYFIAAMMVLIVILCIAAVFAFVKTYRKEMQEKAERATQREKDASENTGQE